jgi:hypothetical protein
MELLYIYIYPPKKRAQLFLSLFVCTIACVRIYVWVGLGLVGGNAFLKALMYSHIYKLYQYVVGTRCTNLSQLKKSCFIINLPVSFSAYTGERPASMIKTIAFKYSSCSVQQFILFVLANCYKPRSKRKKTRILTGKPPKIVTKKSEPHTATGNSLTFTLTNLS